jgi:glycosyltransferase involved in cell wall biosynthesis
MLNVHLLTKNNDQTVTKALESVMALKPTILVGDLGSTDRTVDICDNYGAHIIRMDDRDRSAARNRLIEEAPEGLNMMIEPWEILAQGYENVAEGYVKVLNNQTLSKEVRIWTTGHFVNPVYERLESDVQNEVDVLFYTIGGRDHAEDLRLINLWIEGSPRITSPYYYKACTLMAMGQYDEFLKAAEHFLFLDKTSMSSVMIRYYLSMIYLIHKREYKPVLQNINLCLCARPLMAEFWCLLGDAYYHLLKRFVDAKNFYENAMLLGKRRLANDKWPMDISKYNQYPQKMIESCEKIVESHSTYSHGLFTGRSS